MVMLAIPENELIGTCRYGDSLPQWVMITSRDGGEPSLGSSDIILYYINILSESQKKRHVDDPVLVKIKRVYFYKRSVIAG